MAKAPAAVAPAATVPSGAPSTAAPGQTLGGYASGGSASVAPPGSAPETTKAANMAPVASGAASLPTSQPGSSVNQPGSSGLGPVLSLDPPMVNQAAGATFAINVVLNGGQNVFSVPVQIHYDPNVMRL